MRSTIASFTWSRSMLRVTAIGAPFSLPTHSLDPAYRLSMIAGRLETVRLKPARRSGGDLHGLDRGTEDDGRRRSRDAGARGVRAARLRARGGRAAAARCVRGPLPGPRRGDLRDRPAH